MQHIIIIQFTVDKTLGPKPSLLRKWAKAVLPKNTSTEITIRIVDPIESSHLNKTFRKKNGPTNVLSFSYSTAQTKDLHGDIVICADVVNQEVKSQHKSKEAHWCHIVVHGILHLQGYDHKTDAEAEIMETIEIKILHELGFANPYEDGEFIKNYDG